MTDDQRQYLLIMSTVCTVMVRKGVLQVPLADVASEMPFVADESEIRRICSEVGEEIRIGASGTVHLTTVGFGTAAR